ncbi:SufD family Fe-S cluster assembly protein [Companilactobacillus ginsenosidimutans]|uniref:SufD family Fe-S cluster assembly protein n=1 Tax=Companilactobacillus ginsenosidimutans TaxID=1007676 RepID=UPI0006610291|nr:SufD family Fe-S cluster assembly protein [Companilactobacillus ginsenosidimutans]
MSEELAEQLEQFANEHGEPHWLVKRRLEALTAVKSAPEFSISHFDMAASDNLQKQTPQKIKLTKEVLSAANIDEDEIGLSQIGQSSLENTLDEDDEEGGVILTDIFTAFRQHPRLIENYFMNKVLPEGSNKLTELHTALLNNGMFFYLPKNYQLSDTVHLNIIQDSFHNQDLITHIFIYADQGSSANIVVDARTVGDETNHADVIVEILARPKSQINYTEATHFGKNTKVTINRAAQISRDAQVNWKVAQFNQENTAAHTESNLAHKDAKTDIKIYTLQQGDKKVGSESAIFTEYFETENQNYQQGDAEKAKNIAITTTVSPSDKRDFNYISNNSDVQYEIVSKCSTTDGVTLNPKQYKNEDMKQKFIKGIETLNNSDLTKIVKDNLI